jgi:putative transposase
MINTIHPRTGASIRLICLVLDLPRSSYHQAAEPTPSQLEDITCAPARVRRLMMERGLRALQPKNFIPTTSDGRADCPSPNRLLDQALPEQPNQEWAGDITFIPSSQGWLYLAVVIDLCSRKIVGWSIADHMRSDLVGQALQQALGSRPRVGNLSPSQFESQNIHLN